MWLIDWMCDIAVFLHAITQKYGMQSKCGVPVQFGRRMVPMYFSFE